MAFISVFTYQSMRYFLRKYASKPCLFWEMRKCKPSSISNQAVFQLENIEMQAILELEVQKFKLCRSFS